MIEAQATHPLPVHDMALAVALLGPSLLALNHEEFHVLHLDRWLGLIDHELYAIGSHGQVDVPLRRLLGDALARGSRALILAHNHPTGDITPSQADKAVTRRIIDMIRPLGMTVLDHMIFGWSEWTSFRKLGLM